jgi:hypothetical protein
MKLGLRGLLALATVAYLISASTKILWRSLQPYSDIGYVYDEFVFRTHNGIPYHAYSAISSTSTFVYPAIPSILIWLSGFGLPGKTLYLVRMAWFTYPFVLIAVYFLHRICMELGVDLRRMVPFFALAPSFLVLSFFSWDICAASLVVAAIYYALRKRARLTGFCLGLGFAAKTYPLLLLPVFLREAETWRSRLEMVLSMVVGGLIPNLPFMLIDFSGWFYTVANPLVSESGVGGTTAYVEDSIWTVIEYYRLISQSRIVAAVTWTLIIFTILCVTFSSKSFLLKLWLIEAATVLIYPAYPPQFNVWLLPLFVLNPIFPLLPFLSFDLLNVSIILLWFNVADPFQTWGPIWDIFLTRIGLLAVLLIWAIRRSLTSVPRGGISWFRIKKESYLNRWHTCSKIKNHFVIMDDSI